MSSKTHIVVHADAIKVRLNFVSYNKEPDHSCGGDNSENLLDVIYVHDNSSRAHLESKELTFGPHATRESTVTGTQSLAPTLRVTAWRGHPASPAAQRAEESVIRTEMKRIQPAAKLKAAKQLRSISRRSLKAARFRAAQAEFERTQHLEELWVRFAKTLLRDARICAAQAEFERIHCLEERWPSFVEV